MTEKQFQAALKRRGFNAGPLMGYVEVVTGHHVSYLNAPENTWSSRLAYLIKEARKIRNRKLRWQVVT